MGLGDSVPGCGNGVDSHMARTYYVLLSHGPSVANARSKVKVLRWETFKPAPRETEPRGVLLGTRPSVCRSPTPKRSRSWGQGASSRGSQHRVPAP